MRKVITALVVLTILGGSCYLAYQQVEAITSTDLTIGKRKPIEPLRPTAISSLNLVLPKELDRAHHEVYAEVGEQLWEQVVKPDFMMAVSVRIVLDTGNLVPSTREIQDWLYDHEAEAIQLLKAQIPAKPD